MNSRRRRASSDARSQEDEATRFSIQEGRPRHEIVTLATELNAELSCTARAGIVDWDLSRWLLAICQNAGLTPTRRPRGERAVILQIDFEQPRHTRRKHIRVWRWQLLQSAHFLVDK